MIFGRSIWDDNTKLVLDITKDFTLRPKPKSLSPSSISIEDKPLLFEIVKDSRFIREYSWKVMDWRHGLFEMESEFNELQNPEYTIIDFRYLSLNL